MLKEFKNFGGGIVRLAEKAEDVFGGESDGESLFSSIAIERPAAEIAYKGRRVIYQVCEFSDDSTPLVIVPGYRTSRVRAHQVYGYLIAMVEPVKKEEQEGLERVIKKLTDARWSIKFW